MKKSKRKICMMPKCEKEVFDSETKFCGEHKRKVHDAKIWVAGGTLTALGMMVTAVKKRN